MISWKEVVSNFPNDFADFSNDSTSLSILFSIFAPVALETTVNDLGAFPREAVSSALFCLALNLTPASPLQTKGTVLLICICQRPTKRTVPLVCSAPSIFPLNRHHRLRLKHAEGESTEKVKPTFRLKVNNGEIVVLHFFFCLS